MLKREDFRVMYDVAKIGSIKAWKETKQDGITYPPSVKFRAVNIEVKEDADVGNREVEMIVDFQVTTNTLQEANLLQEAIYQKRDKNEPVLLVGALPRYQSSDEILKIKSTENLEAFCKRNNIVLKANKQ